MMEKKIPKEIIYIFITAIIGGIITLIGYFGQIIYTTESKMENVSMRFHIQADSILFKDKFITDFLQKSVNVRKTSNERRSIEADILLKISSKKKTINVNDLESLYYTTYKLKMDISRDLATLKPFKNFDIGFNEFNLYETYESLISKELEFINNLESYIDFKKVNYSKTVSDEKTFRLNEAIFIELNILNEEIGNKYKYLANDSIFNNYKNRELNVFKTQNLIRENIFKEYKFALFATTILVVIIIVFAILIYLYHPFSRGKTSVFKKRKNSRK